MCRRRSTACSFGGRSSCSSVRVVRKKSNGGGTLLQTSPNFPTRAAAVAKNWNMHWSALFCLCLMFACYHSSMFRAWNARVYVTIFTAVLFLGSGFTPIVANAQGSNICIAANNQCTGTKDKGKPCFCAIVGAYITGVCLAVPNDCKALTWFVNAGPGVSASNGVAVSSLTPSELSAIGLGEQSGIFGQIGP